MSKCVDAMSGERQVRGGVGRGQAWQQAWQAWQQLERAMSLDGGGFLRRLMQQGVT